MTTNVNIRTIAELLIRLDSGFQADLDRYLTALDIRYNYGSWSTSFTVSSGTSLVKYVNRRGAIRDTFLEGFQAVRVTNTSDASADFRVRAATPTDAPEVVSLKHKIRKDLIARVQSAQTQAKGARVSRS